MGNRAGTIGQSPTGMKEVIFSDVTRAKSMWGWVWERGLGEVREKIRTVIRSLLTEIDRIFYLDFRL